MDVTWMWMTLCRSCELWGTVATGCWRGYSGMCLFWLLQWVSTVFNFHSWLVDSIEEIQDLTGSVKIYLPGCSHVMDCLAKMLTSSVV